MLAHERQAIIIEHLRQHRVIKIADMVERFGISSLTARRDLDALRDRGILRRVYGGAVLTVDPSTLAADILQSAQDLQERQSTNERKALAKLTASLVEEGDVLFLGNGSMVHEVAKHLRHFSNLTIVTSSLAVINEMASTNNTVYILGGRLDSSEHSIGTLGDYATLRRFCADKTIISCDGVSARHGVSSYNPVGADIGRIMVENCDRAILVGRSVMFDSNAMCIVCPLDSISTVVTDDSLSLECRDSIDALGVQLLIANTSSRSEPEPERPADTPPPPPPPSSFPAQDEHK